MCILWIFNAFRHLLLRKKTDVLKNLKKCTSFKEQKGTRYIRESFYFGIIIFSCLSSAKSCPRFLLNCFAREIKGFYQSSLRNNVDFRDIMNVSRNILTKNQNFKKMRHRFVGERALITTTLISSCHWKILVPFCLRTIRPENAFLTIMVNYGKIVQKNKLYYSKVGYLIGYLMIYDAIYSLLVLIEKLGFFKKQL